MKKIILSLLLIIISLQSFADLSRTAPFNFSQPATLSPSITLGTYHSAFAMVTDVTFTYGLATVSFSSGPAELDTWNPTGTNPSYYLSLSRGTYMVVSVQEGCTIDKVIINKGGSDPVYLLADRGTYTTSTGTWTPGSDSYKQVGLYYTSSQAPIIENVEVEYTETSMVLEAQIPSKYSEPQKTFSQLEVVFPNAQGFLTVQGVPNITIQGNYDNESFGSVNTTMTAQASNTEKTGVLTLTTPIAHDGTFQIHVPDLTFRDGAGYETKGFDVTIRVEEERATFDTVSVKALNIENEYVYLNGQDVYKFPEEIFLGFASNVGHIDETAEFEVKREGVTAPVARMKLETVDSDNKIVKLVIVPGSKASDEWPLGTYTIKVSEEKIFDNNYKTIWETFNPEMNITFNLVQQPNPLQPLWDKLEELKAKADELLKLKGTVGYPKEDVSPKKLEDLVKLEAATTNENGELDAQIADMKVAIKAFYDATDVVLPKAATNDEDGWYTIISVADGSELPLNYSNGSVTVGGTATPFQVTSITDEGVIVLKTKDEKYLHVLTTVTESTTTSAKNVTDKYIQAVNDLSIKKLKLAGDDTDQEPVAGLFTIEGSLGRDGKDTPLGNATALVAHPTGNILTSASDNTLYFATDKSSGFRFVAAEGPDVPSVEPEVKVTPIAKFEGSIVDSNTTMLTLTLKGEEDDDITTVSLNPSAAPKFAKRLPNESVGDDVTDSFKGDKILELYGNTPTYQFKVHIDGLEAGDYYLILPEGTFDYSANAKSVTDKELQVAFTISSTSGGGGEGEGGSGSGGSHKFKKDLAQIQPYSSSPYFDGDVAVHPSELNEFRVYSYKREGETDQTFFANPEVEVILGAYFSSKEFFRGKFVFDPSYQSEQVWCYKIVWEHPITEKDFPDETYNLGIIVEEGTFGDKNYNSWLKDHNSVSEENCHVNPRFVTFVKVNASAPSKEEKTAFENYQAENYAAASGKAKVGDSQACADLISAAKSAINALSYDSTKTLAENKALVDAIISKLDKDLADQRAKDATNAEFATYKTEQKTVADGKAQQGDSDECKALITAAKAAIDALTFDNSKSLDANKALVDAIITKLDADLATQRAYDASKAALSKSVADATAYYESIKESHAAIAKLLNNAIESAKTQLNATTSTKSDLDTAKQNLDSALEAAKEAVTTGITTISLEDEAFDGAAIFTIDGRKLDGKPTKKGVYIVNGKKVVIK